MRLLPVLSRRRCLFVCFAVVALHADTAPAADPPPIAGEQRVTVFRAGEEGYPGYRIPAVVQAGNGDLLAFCEARQGNDASEIDLVLKRSSDGGRTWSGIQAVQDGDAFRDWFGPNPPPITVGNPAPLVDQLNADHPGRIWLPFTVENSRVCVVYSDDHGASWSAPREITADVKLEPWGWYATGPGHSIQIQQGPHRGRLIVPCDHRLGDEGADRGANGAHVIYSDDHGQRWQLGAIDATYNDGLNANETSVVDLSDGVLYFNTRNQNGDAPSTRGEAYSDDGGFSLQPTRETPHAVSQGADGGWKVFRPCPPILDPPVVQCSLLRALLPDPVHPESSLVLFGGPDENGPSGRGRSDFRLRYSTDETQTWSDGPLIHVGPAAYSDLVPLGAGQIGILFEAGSAESRNPYQRIDFVTLHVDSIATRQR